MKKKIRTRKIGDRLYKGDYIEKDGRLYRVCEVNGPYISIRLVNQELEND